MNQERVTRLQTELKRNKMAGVALLPGPNLLYFSGMHAHMSERPLVLFVPAEGDPAVIIPLLEAPKAVKAGIPQDRIFAWGDGEGYDEAFQTACDALELSNQVLGVESLYMRVLELDLLKASAGGLIHTYADPILNRLRLIKSEAELEKMKRAIAVAEEALHSILPQIKIGMTEKEIAAMLTQALNVAGADAVPFGPIVSAGPNGASPHAVPTDRPIQDGDLMIIDWGALIDDYPSDITRTFAVGEIGPQQKRMYQAVLAANLAGIAVTEPENSCSEVDEAAREIIADADLGQYFIHRTGHGLGLELHEAPSMITGNEDPLLTGMTFTIEPGVYIPELGGVRIEDDVVVTADGCEVLTTFPKQLMRVG